MTDTATGSLARAAALHALLAGNTGQEAPAPTIVHTGVTVFAGGDVERVLIATTNLVYRSGEFLYRAPAEVGDTITVLPEQAERLDKLGATIDPTIAEEVADDAARIDAALNAGLAATPPPGVTAWTDDQIRSAKAPDLIAYVGQYPDERARVRTIEEARGEVGTKRGARTTIMNATEPTPLEDDEVAARVQAQQEADEAANLAAKAAEEAGNTPDEAPAE
jgi:hypothetical protein